MKRWHATWAIAVGALAGAAGGMNALTAHDPQTISAPRLFQFIGGSAALMATLLCLIQAAVRRLVPKLLPWPPTQEKFLRYDALTVLIFLATFAGAFGVIFGPTLIAAMLLLFVLLKAAVLYFALTADQRRHISASLGWLAFLFLISGFAALIYQIVWQRVLFAAFGVNIESITIIVSLFMFGLGVGSLVGGWFSAKWPEHAAVLFLSCELGIGAFGLVSLPLIRAVSSFTLHGSLLTISIAIFALLCIPTMLMGATLPILVGHLHRYYKNVGKSVGILYCINTLGSAIACFLTADVLFVLFGQQAAVIIAAACNIVVGVLISRYAVTVRDTVATTEYTESTEVRRR